LFSATEIVEDFLFLCGRCGGDRLVCQHGHQSVLWRCRWNSEGTQDIISYQGVCLVVGNRNVKLLSVMSLPYFVKIGIILFFIMTAFLYPPP